MIESIVASGEGGRSTKRHLPGHVFASSLVALFLSLLGVATYQLDFWQTYFFADSQIVQEGCLVRTLKHESPAWPGQGWDAAPANRQAVPHWGKALFDSSPLSGRVAHLLYECEMPLENLPARPGVVNIHVGWVVGEYSEIRVNGTVRSTFYGTDKPVIGLKAEDLQQSHLTLSIWTRSHDSTFIGLLGTAPLTIVEGLRRNNKVYGLETALQQIKSLFNLLPVLTMGCVLVFGWVSGIRSRLLIMTLFYFIMIACQYALPYASDLLPWDPQRPYAIQRAFYIGTFLSYGLFGMEILSIGVRWIQRGMLATSLLVIVEAIVLATVDDVGVQAVQWLDPLHYVILFALTSALWYFGRRKLRQPADDPSLHKVRSLFLRCTLIFVAIALADQAMIRMSVPIRLSRHMDLIMPLFIGGVVLYTLALVEKRLRAEREHRAKVENELALAANLQHIIVPSDLDGVAHQWHYQISSVAHDILGGDWIKAHAGENGALFVLGDVVGKGASAALTHSGIAAIWDMQMRSWDKGLASAEDVIHAINTTMWKLYQGGMNTTFAIADVKPDGTARVAAAGHHWLHLGAGVARSVVSASSSPLGVQGELTIKFTELKLAPGDWLVCFSDGVLEGGRGIKRFLRGAQDDFPQLTGDKVRTLLIEAGKDAVHDDDASTLILRFDRALAGAAPASRPAPGAA